MSLDSGASLPAPPPVKEFVPQVSEVFIEEPKVPSNEKEYQDAYHALRKENEELKQSLVSKDIRIRQLEAQLENLKA